MYDHLATGNFKDLKKKFEVSFHQEAEVKVIPDLQVCEFTNRNAGT